MKYFEYDGTLTTDTFSPVRWIIDDNVLKLNIKDIIRVAKVSRQIQNNDGRIILFKNWKFFKQLLCCTIK